MATQVELAQKGVITDAMQAIAKDEGMEPELVRERFANGRIVAPLNKQPPCRVGGHGPGHAHQDQRQHRHLDRPG
jgi:thiamine biosynthesis protein ThiC